jgi:hypothetical protein
MGIDLVGMTFARFSRARKLWLCTSDTDRDCGNRVETSGGDYGPKKQLAHWHATDLIGRTIVAKFAKAVADSEYSLRFVR